MSELIRNKNKKKKKTVPDVKLSPSKSSPKNNPTTSRKGSVAHEWRDCDSEVRVTLLTGPLGPAVSQVTFTCAPSSVRVDLPGGQSWSSQLFTIVLPDGSGWQHKGGKVLLRLLKLDPKVKWPSLEPVKPLRSGRAQATKEMKDKTNIEKSRTCGPPVVHDRHILDESDVKSDIDAKEKTTLVNPMVLGKVELITETSAASLPSDVRGAINDKEAKTKNCSSVDPVIQDNKTLESSVTEINNHAPIVLDNVKYDMYETESYVRVSMYVKQVSNESVDVTYDSDSFNVVFSTGDARFLTLHGCGSAGDRFLWKVQLAGTILPDSCSHSVTNSALQLQLVKAAHVRWNALQPLLAAQTPVPPTQTLGSPVQTPVPPTQTPPPPAQTPPPVQTPPPSTAQPAESAAGPELGITVRPIPLPPPPLLQSAGLPDPSAGGDHQLNTAKQGRSPPPPLALPAPPARPTSTVEPGLTGLDNIGNTCFLNSVIQCLANTRELRDYFADSVFQADINRENPLGTGGQLALSFAVLLRVLWSGEYRSHNPHQLKALVAKKATQFTGFAQHDAQEFMAFLLDGLHEDLNRVRVKPCTETVEGGDGADDVAVAHEAWRRYLLRNDSVIVDLFQGQYRSKLVCPSCAKVSVTFDPFLYLSIPMPKKKRLVSVTFFRVDPTVRPVTYQLYVSPDSTTDEIMEGLSGKTGVSPKFIKIIEERNHKVLKVYQRGSSVSSIGRTSHMLAFEQLDPADVGEEVVELVVIQRLLYPAAPRQCAACRREPTPGGRLRRCTRCYRIGYCDPTCQRDHWPQHRPLCRPVSPEPVGCPFVVSLPRSQATYARLCAQMEAFSRHSVNVFCVPVTSASERRDSSSSNASSDSGKCTDNEELAEKECDAGGSGDSAGCREPLSNSGDEDKQLFFIKPVTAHGVSVTTPDGGRLQDDGERPLPLPSTFTVAMDWKTHQRCRPCCLVEDRPLDTLLEPAPAEQPVQEFTLQQCLQLFTQPEQLSPGEAWYCPRCKTHREAEKQMGLWRTPLNLIVQLKRFSFKDLIFRDKIDKMVTFPLRGLDLSPYLTHAAESATAVYDLYAVINHHGSILGGHYTAFARCVDPLHPLNAEHDWRLFDDSRVRHVPEERVVTSEAYLLFYRRRVPYPGVSGSSGSRAGHMKGATHTSEQVPLITCTDAEEID